MTESIEQPLDHNRREIVDLIVEFAWRVDHGMASSIPEIVTEDIEMTLTVGTMKGKDAIRDWGSRRDTTGKTTSHLMSNYRFSAEADDLIEVDSSAVIFVHSGSDIGSALPWGVTEYHDVFVKSEDGWKFRSRISKDIFMSGEH